METINYCRDIGSQLDKWKFRIDTAVRFMDGLSNHQKEDAYPLMRTLRQTLLEIDGKRAELGSVCPLGWDTGASDRENRMRRLETTLKALSESCLGARLSETVSWV